ncbi:MAG TPA: TPM domain-containing protein [Flavobacterium sp.]|jgi:uncharacterized membrane protein
MASADSFLSKEDELEIVGAIRLAEKETSGEIRVHIEKKASVDAFTRATEVFHLLKMDNTKLQNGVLIYLAVDDHQFAIIGDKGINDIVGHDFWDSTKDIMVSHFRDGNFKQGLIDGIRRAGEQLQKHFPWESHDTDELSNEISRS